MALNRREFLYGASAAAGAVALTSTNLYALQPSERVAVGVVGTGGRGGYLMNLVMAHPAADIVAVCDVHQSNLARAVKQVESAQGRRPREHVDFRRLLDDTSIDAVVIATPHHWHVPIALQALEAGKHIYLEKPASHVFREGRLLVEAAQRHQRFVQHGTQMRSSDVTAAAGEVLQRGLLGEIKMAKAWGVEPRAHHPAPVPDSQPPDELNYDFWLGPAPQRAFNVNRFRRWNSYRDYGNGEIAGDGIHDIDMARWGLGVTTHPNRITAHGSRVHLQGESDFPDNMIVTYQYDDAGKVLVYENRNFAPYTMHGYDNGNVFYGTEGYMVFSRRGYFQTFLGKLEEQGPGMKGDSGIERHVAAFLDGVRKKVAPQADAEVAHLSCALSHLGDIAYRTGRVLHFDPQAERMIDDTEADAMLSKTYRDLPA